VAATTGCTGALGGGSGGGSYDCSVTETEPVESLRQPALGPDDAAVTVQSWEDYSCPHCATFSLDVIPKLRETYVDGGNQVRFEFHDFPIPVRDWAWTAHSAGRAVQDIEGDEAYFEFSHALFEAQSDYTQAVLGDAGEAAGVDACAAIGHGAEETYRPVVETDRSRGIEAGVEGAPAVFVNGDPIAFEGGIAFDPLKSAIESAL
jgi:protein-disulfide isomerase